MVNTRSMATSSTHSKSSLVAPTVMTVTHADLHHRYNLRPRYSKLVVTVPAGPYNLRPRVQFH
jgi:hypothetical protein